MPALRQAPYLPREANRKDTDFDLYPPDQRWQTRQQAITTWCERFWEARGRPLNSCQAVQEGFLEELVLEPSFEGQVWIIQVKRCVCVWICKGGRLAMTVFHKVQSPFPSSLILFGVDVMLVGKFTDWSFLLVLQSLEGLGWKAIVFITEGESEALLWQTEWLLKEPSLWLGSLFTFSLSLSGIREMDGIPSLLIDEEAKA